MQNNQASGPETCGNGLDDDCNGTADDGCGCAHDPCVSGGALISGCDPCVTQVCASDTFCCSSSWDSLCTGEVSSVCGQVCTGSCAHTPCSSGAALVSGCDPGGCVTQVCTSDTFCCDTSWDNLCVGEVEHDLRADLLTRPAGRATRGATKGAPPAAPADRPGRRPPG